MLVNVDIVCCSYVVFQGGWCVLQCNGDVVYKVTMCSHVSLCYSKKNHAYAEL